MQIFFCSYLLVLLYCTFDRTFAISDKLVAFHKAFEDAKQELENIKNSLAIDDEELLRQRRRSIDELLSSFRHDVELADKLEETDELYRNTEKNNADAARCKSNRCGDDWKLTPRNIKKRINLDSDLNEIAKLNLKYKGVTNKLRSFTSPSIFEDEPGTDSTKFKSILDKIEENNVRIGTIIQNAGFGEGNEAPVKPNPIPSSTKISQTPKVDNTLRDVFSEFSGVKDTKSLPFNFENYEPKTNKLDNLDFNKDKSKPEFNFNVNLKPDIKTNGVPLESVLQSIDTSNIVNDQVEQEKNDLSHEANYKLSKIEQDAAERKKDVSWKTRSEGLLKRTARFNPLSEIKLKTSNRLMDRGYGPSLPSNSLFEMRRMMKIDDMLKRMEKSYDPETSNKNDFQKLDNLLSVDDNNFDVLKMRFKRLQDQPTQQSSSLNSAAPATQDKNMNKEDEEIVNDQNENSVERTGNPGDGETQSLKPEYSAAFREGMRKMRYNDMKRILARNYGSTLSDKNFNEAENKKIYSRAADDIADSVDNVSAVVDDDDEEPKQSSPTNTNDFIENNLKAVAAYQDAELQLEPQITQKVRRQKRSATSEANMFLNSREFDTFEFNEDETHIRLKRATDLSTVENATRSLYGNATAHKLHKRFAHLQDDVNDNSIANQKLLNQLVKVIDDTGVPDDGDVIENDFGLLNIPRTKRLSTTTNFDFGNAARMLGIEHFDNMKPKAALMNVEGMKFDNFFTEKDKNNKNVLVYDEQAYEKNRMNKYLHGKAKLTNVGQLNEKMLYNTKQLVNTAKMNNTKKVINDSNKRDFIHTNTNANTISKNNINNNKINNNNNNINKNDTGGYQYVYDTNNDNNKNNKNNNNFNLINTENANNNNPKNSNNKNLDNTTDYTLYNVLNNAENNIKNNLSQSHNNNNNDDFNNNNSNKNNNNNNDLFNDNNNNSNNKNNNDIFNDNNSNSNNNNNKNNNNNNDFIEHNINNNFINNNNNNNNNNNINGIHNNNNNAFSNNNNNNNNNFNNNQNNGNGNGNGNNNNNNNENFLNNNVFTSRINKNQTSTNSDNNLIEKDNDKSNLDGKKLILALRDEILNCTAFSKLENFLKDVGNQKSLVNMTKIAEIAMSVNPLGNKTKDRNNSTKTESNKNSMESESNQKHNNNNITMTNESNQNKHNNNDNDNNNNTMENEANPKNHNMESNKKNNNNGNTDSNTWKSESNPKNNDLMKLNITINASIMGLNRKASSYSGNGSIDVQPGVTELRERRGIIFPGFDDVDKRDDKCKDDKDCDSNQALENMISGKSSSQIVEAMFNIVRDCNKMQPLWSALKDNRIPNTQPSSNYNASKTLDAESRMKNTEKLIQKAMCTINDIIEQQVRLRTCIPLRPDLSEFYELILQTYADSENNRGKRESIMSLANEFSKEVRSIDPNKIEEKSRVVKKLLRQYEDLPEEDQEQVSSIRDDLLRDLMYLRKLKENHELALERRKRESEQQKQRELSNEPVDSELVKRLEADYTPAFLKLLKTSEIFREAENEKEQL